jgi:prepilin-type N-terminal cleavage/methylation domain-containing protein
MTDMRTPTVFRGFTLIELLVVIAIIGILSSVVLASLNTARNKGADSAIKANLSNARAQAELFYDSNSNSYDAGTAATDVCTSTGVSGVKGISSMLAGAQSAGSASVTCNSSASAWALSAQLKTNTAQYWCVDYTGTSTLKTAALGAATNC